MENSLTDATNTASEEEQFKEFRRLKRREEAAANVAKLECDCLSPATDKTTLRELCRSANSMKLGGIVVYPYMVKACVAYLGADPQCSLIASISSKCGGDATEVKADAVKRAVKDGVDETEVWAPTFFIRDGNFVYLKRECKKLAKASRNRALRIVLDCAALREQEVLKACSVIAETGVNCVRLAGGSSELTAKVKSAVKGKCMVKSDGINSFAAFANFTVMGADCIHASNATELAAQLLMQAEEQE